MSALAYIIMSGVGVVTVACFWQGNRASARSVHSATMALADYQRKAFEAEAALANSYGSASNSAMNAMGQHNAHSQSAASLFNSVR